MKDSVVVTFIELPRVRHLVINVVPEFEDTEIDFYLFKAADGELPPYTAIRLRFSEEAGGMQVIDEWTSEKFKT
jgi:hypothetical protein